MTLFYSGEELKINQVLFWYMTFGVFKIEQK